MGANKENESGESGGGLSGNLGLRQGKVGSTTRTLNPLDEEDKDCRGEWANNKAYASRKKGEFGRHSGGRIEKASCVT
jgi:hypothetical protein